METINCVICFGLVVYGVGIIGSLAYFKRKKLMPQIVDRIEKNMDSGIIKRLESLNRSCDDLHEFSLTGSGDEWFVYMRIIGTPYYKYWFGDSPLGVLDKALEDLSKIQGEVNK